MRALKPRGGASVGCPNIDGMGMLGAGQRVGSDCVGSVNPNGLRRGSVGSVELFSPFL